ncbi:hypothetical protein DFH07DRAFT_957151 [Mycena maculata]|uniref:Ribonuclease H1 N-terminal domain-containing protein n=1 Tax=Mycena maculata TaxID=230809 RepID=A0AAD7JFQ1_9AGAR|nr:hypothetical protein DFH07DRAFT_957151 [Mycena maculata]
MVDPDPTELDEILRLIGELNVGNGNDSAPRTAPRLPPPPLPAQRSAASAPPLPALGTPERAPRLYHVTTPTQGSLYTENWEHAAHQIREGGTARRLTPNTKKRRHKGGYAVFIGRDVGPFRTWPEVEAMVRGVSCSIQQGYSTFEGATAAFEYAWLRGWTRRVPDDSFIVPSAVLPPAIPWLPQPPAFSDAPNPLHGEHNSLWYIVYCGITPGVYPSSVECHLNTVGITNSVFDSCDTKEVAILRYQTALADGRIKVLTPIYHS